MDINRSYYGQVRSEIEVLLPASFKTVLEIGCGSGGTMRWLRKIRAVRYAAAVELMPAAAAVAREIFDHVETSSLSDASFDFEHKKFDLVIALDVLEHLENPDQVVRKLNDLMNDGGTIIVSLPNVGHYSVSWPLFLKGQWDYGDAGLLDRTHLRFFSNKTAVNLLTQNGFEIKEQHANFSFPNIFSLVGLNSPKWRWCSNRVLTAAFPIFRHLFVIQYMIAAIK